MNREEQWLLPDGVEELLPQQAAAVEALRRQILDHYGRCGYQLVFPPLIEFLESLLNGAGRDLENDTVKLTDQMSGRLMGVRPDITPQVARMDAHSLRREGPARLCYCSTSMRTRSKQPGGSRLPYQIGVELFGHAGFESDAEVVALLLDTLAIGRVDNVTLELGHVGLFGALMTAAKLAAGDVDVLSDIYQRKASTELDAFLQQQTLPEPLKTLLKRLPALCGDAALLRQERQHFAGIAGAERAFDELEQLVGWLHDAYPQVNVYLDLAELRGYHYHTGCVFAAYLCGASEPVAKGGRYDHIGEVFGRARAATGFSADLKALAALYAPARQDGILAEGDIRDPAFRQAVTQLRNQDERVVLVLPNTLTDAGELQCNRRLVLDNQGRPQVTFITDSE